MQMRTMTLAICLVAGFQPAQGGACGYDNPQAVALGSLNWVYPDALHVRAAVWRAEDEGLLPAGGRADVSGPLAFYRAAAAVKKLGASLTHSLPTESGMAISVVLIPQVMWTRFEVGPEGLTVQSHAEGPRADDLVIVTEEKVVRALVDGKIEPEAAEERGLLRFYGDPEEIANVRSSLAMASRADHVSPSHPAERLVLPRDAERDRAGRARNLARSRTDGSNRRAGHSQGQALRPGRADEEDQG